MIPSALITHLEEGMEDFLRASFWSSTPAFEGLLERFLEDWDDVKDMQYGTVEQIIIDDTLPVERIITYVAPFTRCDREEVYRTAEFENRGVA